MNYSEWLNNNAVSLKGKTIALTGSTGGIGNELCRHLLKIDAKLVLIDRNKSKSEALKRQLESEFANADIKSITADLEDIKSVDLACEKLAKTDIDIFIHNAGAYSIPRHKCSTGYDNVFQINFVSPYYMIRKLLPYLKERHGKVIVVGSIAHNYSVADENDIDFSTRKQASLVYGNAKRYLMFALNELFVNEKNVKFAIAHPGITFTNITAHYPKLIFAVIKHPMKIIFMKPKKASLSIIKAIFDDCGYCEWIGPKIFDVWGLPSKKKLKTCDGAERKQIDKFANEIYAKLQ